MSDSKRRKKKRLNLMKDLLINEIKSEIIPNVPDYELGKLIKYLKELQDELKVHLNILEKSEDINTKNYDNSQLELMRIFQMIQMQVVIIGKTLWVQRLSAVKRVEEYSIYIYIYIIYIYIYQSNKSKKIIILHQ